MITKEQALDALISFLETRNPDDAYIVADYLLQEEIEEKKNANKKG